jgi:hypothetical protein
MKDSDIVTQVAEHASAAKTQVNKYGNVPVFYAPKKRWVKPPKSPSLSHFIQQATTEAEVNKLLERGKTKFEGAQPKTIRKWEQEAEIKIAKLKAVQ